MDRLRLKFENKVEELLAVPAVPSVPKLFHFIFTLYPFYPILNSIFSTHDWDLSRSRITKTWDTWDTSTKQVKHWET